MRVAENTTNKSSYTIQKEVNSLKIYLQSKTYRAHFLNSLCKTVS